MSAVAENILTGLPAGRAAVFLGEAGCGKSELAVHLALSLAGQGREVHFFDLDQTKPLMRSRDAQELLEGAGVTVHFERQTADAPTPGGRARARCCSRRTKTLSWMSAAATQARA